MSTEVIDVDNEAPAPPLFLPDFDDFPMDDVPKEAEYDAPTASPPTPPAKRALMPHIDTSLEDEFNRDFSLGTPGLNLDEMRKQALARERMHQVAQENARKHAAIGHAAIATGGAQPQMKAQKKAEGELKKRKPIPKLNDERLLGQDGFPALLKEYKNFKPKGKGHEQEDLTRLLQMYQFWTHKMFPKMQFDDAVNRIEKVCHSRRMLISMSVWKDEAKNGPRKPGQKDEESDDDAAEDAERAERSSPDRSSPSSSAPPRKNDDNWTVDSELEKEGKLVKGGQQAKTARKEGRESSAPPPPSSSPEPDGYPDEDDLLSDGPHAAPGPKPSGDDLDAEEMNMDWGEDDAPVMLGGGSPPRLMKKAPAPPPASPPAPAPSAKPTGLEDFDMSDFDAFDDMELEDDPAPSQPTAQSKTSEARTAANTAAKPASGAEDDLDFPEMEEYTQAELDALDQMLEEAEMYS
ncbi:Swi3-domain-containing protein [Auricularia subglabra TFB-10046 SS5]|nr:Swi3-domain-containing protein [Auricularia subglabra TFB-10046 SS5]